MVDCCRWDTGVPALIWTVLLYCGRCKRGQAPGRTGMERQAGCRRGKRLGKNMRRISPRTVLIVTSGTAENRSVQSIAAIISSRKKRGKELMKEVEIPESAGAAHMGGTHHVSVIVCRRFCWRCGEGNAVKGKEGDLIYRMKSTRRL